MITYFVPELRMISHKNTHTKYLLMSAIQSYLFSMRAQMIHYDWITPFVLMRWIGIGFVDNALYKTWLYLVNTYSNFCVYIIISKSEWYWYLINKTHHNMNFPMHIGSKGIFQFNGWSFAYCTWCISYKWGKLTYRSSVSTTSDAQGRFI